MASVKRLHQVFAKVEGQDGDAVDPTVLFTAPYAGTLVIEPAMVFEPEFFDRSNINRPSVSPLQPLAGVTPGSFTFQMELAGAQSGGNPNTPTFASFLVAAGMRQTNISTPEISATSKNAWQGTTFIQDTSLARFRLVRSFHGDPSPVPGSKVWLESIDSITPTNDNLRADIGTAVAVIDPIPSPSFAVTGNAWFPASLPQLTIVIAAPGADVPTGFGNIGDVLIGQTSGATGVLMETLAGTNTAIHLRRLDKLFVGGEALRFDGMPDIDPDVGNITASGISQDPQLYALSMGIIEDGRRRQIHGARGTFSIAGEIGQAALFTFNYKGLITDAGIDDAGPIGGVTYKQTVPPVLLGIELAVSDDTITDVADLPAVRLQSFSFDHGSTVEIPREMVEATGLYDAAHIVGRDSTGSLNVSVAPESVYNFLELFANGAAVNATITARDSNDLDFCIAATFILSSESGGDQNGFATTDFSLKLASRVVGDVDIDDSELVISFTS